MKVSVAVPSFAPSATDGASISSLGWPSSSQMTSFTSSGSSTPRPPAALADRVNALSFAVTALSTAVTVTVPALSVSPAAIVSFRLPPNRKSPATAGDTGVADTVSVRSSLEAPSRLAVTVLAPPFSPIAGGVSFSVARGVASSSVIVPRAVPVPAATRAAGESRSVTATRSLGSSIASPRTRTTMSAAVDPGGKVTEAGTGVSWSAPSVAVPPRLNGTVTASALGTDRVTAKVMSAVRSGSSPSTTAPAPVTETVRIPASVIVPAPSSVSASPARSALTAPDSRSTTVSSSSGTSSPLTVTSMVFWISSGANVSFPAVSRA